MVTTIIMPISRPDYLKRVFANLEMMECDASETALLILVDGDMELYEVARNFTVKSKFAEKLCVYRRKGNPNVSSVHRRRQRIADIHAEMQELIKSSEYIFMIEDDTLFSGLTLHNLLKLYSEYPYAGFISGVQIGRWGYTHIGAWLFDDVYKPNNITSAPKGKGMLEVDAAGFFCCLTKREYYMKHHFEPYDTILGPDVNYGIYLRQMGLLNYIDYGITCTHLTKKGEIKFINTPIQQVTFHRPDNIKVWIQSASQEDENK